MRRLQHSTEQQTKQIQRLILTPQMQQALHLLQMPVMEVVSLIREELSQNPILEIDESEEEPEIETLLDIAPTKHKKNGESEDIQSFIENTVPYEFSLFESLLQQARETFSHPEELHLARWIIGSLDADGLLKIPLDEIVAFTEATQEKIKDVLEKIQSFDPPGVAAQSMQEALLIQLKTSGRGDSLAFRIIHNHFEDILHNRIPSIAKAMARPSHEIYEAIADEIAHLELFPGRGESLGHYREIVQSVIPDVTLHYSDDKFSIEINEEKLPHIRVNFSYLKMLEEANLSEETRVYIQEKISSGKWLMRNLYERHQTLYRITEELNKTQKEFFTNPSGKLKPLTMKEIAEKLDLHESTIARAVANKYLASPRGVFPLRSFFTHAYKSEEGETISASTVKDLLSDLLSKEDRRHPLSDEELSSRIREKGIECARRTVAKYRHELGIGNTSQRRLHFD